MKNRVSRKMVAIVGIFALALTWVAAGEAASGVGAMFSAERITNAVKGKTLYSVFNTGECSDKSKLWHNRFSWGKVRFNTAATKLRYVEYAPRDTDMKISTHIVKNGIVFTFDDGSKQFARVTAMDDRLIRLEDGREFIVLYFKKEDAKKAYWSHKVQSRFTHALLEGKTFYYADGMSLNLSKVSFDEDQMKIYNLETGAVVEAYDYRIEDGELIVGYDGFRAQLQRKTSKFLQMRAFLPDSPSFDRTNWFEKTYGRSVASLDRDPEKLARVFIKKRYKNRILKPDGRILGKKTTGSWEVVQKRLFLALPQYTGTIRYQSFHFTKDNHLILTEDARYLAEIRLYTTEADARRYLRTHRKGDRSVSWTRVIAGKRFYSSIWGDDGKEIEELIFKNDQNGTIVLRRFNFEKRKYESAPIGHYRIHDDKALLIMNFNNGTRGYFELVERRRGYIVLKRFDDLLDHLYLYFDRQGAANGIVETGTANCLFFERI